MGFIMLALLLGAVAQLCRLFMTARGKIVQNKIGNGVGLSFNEIRRKLGSPQAESVNADGDTVYQWMMNSSGGAYHYAYVFRDGVCQGLAYRMRA